MFRRIVCAFIACTLLIPAFASADELQDAVKKLPDEALLYLYSVVVDEMQSRGISFPDGSDIRISDQPDDGNMRTAAKEALSGITRSTPSPTYAPLIQISDIDTVWISKSGKRYHTIPECSNMKNPSPVTLSEAIASGRDACRDCAYWISELEE